MQSRANQLRPITNLWTNPIECVAVAAWHVDRPNFVFVCLFYFVRLLSGGGGRAGQKCKDLCSDVRSFRSSLYRNFGSHLALGLRRLFCLIAKHGLPLATATLFIQVVSTGLLTSLQILAPVSVAPQPCSFMSIIEFVCHVSHIYREVPKTKWNIMAHGLC